MAGTRDAGLTFVALCAAAGACASTVGADSGAGEVWFRDEGCCVIVVLMWRGAAGASTGAPGLATVGAGEDVLDAVTVACLLARSLAASSRGPDQTA